MNNTTAIVFIVIGALTAVLKGLFNVGNSFGRGKRFVEMVGAVSARIIYGVIGVAICVIGIVFLVTNQ